MYEHGAIGPVGLVGQAAADGVGRTVIGWDVGGAHVKACLLQRGQVHDVAQWACPLWQGLDRLDAALAQAAQRWPVLVGADHAVTMTGEMVDLFADRAQGVSRIAAQLARLLPGRLHFFAGERGWCAGRDAGGLWPHIASANWLACAYQVAQALQPHHAGAALLIDIGSTTTDLVALRDGRVLAGGRSDAERLASGELVYHGVVRTPLCALARRVSLQGRVYNVMNEWFATTADVYRLTEELDAAHDQQPSADGSGKDLQATRQRLARMVGLDQAAASADDWLSCARDWRRHQVAEIASQLRRVLRAHGLVGAAHVVRAGCGAFLVPDVLAAAGLPAHTPVLAYGGELVPLARADLAGWVQVCAPAVAVAALFDRYEAEVS